jgi:hypothetical protein
MCAAMSMLDLLLEPKVWSAAATAAATTSDEEEAVGVVVA